MNDVTQEDLKKRTLLKPAMDKAYREGKKAVFRNGSLFINGQIYRDRPVALQNNVPPQQVTHQGDRAHIKTPKQVTPTRTASTDDQSLNLPPPLQDERRNRHQSHQNGTPQNGNQVRDKVRLALLNSGAEWATTATGNLETATETMQEATYGRTQETQGTQNGGGTG